MNIDELAAELKEVAAVLNRVKHYVTKENIPRESGVPPVVALMLHHESLQNELRLKRPLSNSNFDSVAVPTNVEQARAMATLGTQWLMDNAPSELTMPYQQLALCRKQNRHMTSLLTDINEYCQQNNIGTIGDSSSKALMTHHQALIEGRSVPIYQYREIGETNWQVCSLNWYRHCQASPEHDTKIIYHEVTNRD